MMTGIILIIGLGMLVAPIWWLQKATSLGVRLAIISGFVTVFMVMVSLMTAVRASVKPFETLAATSA